VNGEINIKYISSAIMLNLILKLTFNINRGNARNIIDTYYQLF